MSKVIYACLRRGTERDVAEVKRRIALGADRISPECAGMRSHSITTDGKEIAGVLNPSSVMVGKPGFVGVGHIATDSIVRRIGGERPEGAYAICRSDGRVLELLSDSVGSRTLWYYIDSGLFIASTSQRWILSVLGNFEPCRTAITWMLATGTLGPTDPWDRRLHRLQANSTLTLDLESWSTRLVCEQPVFQVDAGSEAEQKQRLRGCLADVFQLFRFDSEKWILPLSGGYDSRAILCSLHNIDGLRAITWGTGASMRKSRSDAVVAAKLAKAAGIAHEFFEMDPAPGALSTVLERFVAYGEGRTANVAGYLDGFTVWRALVERGIEGIIRGDEAFGWVSVDSAWDARRTTGLRLWEDYEELPHRAHFDLPPQEIPEFLHQEEHETASQWRDRLYQQYRIPTFLAALTDLKSPFVEVANPLLTDSIIKVARSMPDALRTEKRLFKEVVDELSPPVPYATQRAIAHQDSILRSAEAKQMLVDVLASEEARGLLSASLLNFIAAKIGEGSERRRLWSKTRVFRFIAQRSRQASPVPRNPKLRIDFNQIAWRVYIICKSHELLQADAAAADRHT